MREKKSYTVRRNNLKTDVIVSTILILTSLCCLYFLNGYGKQNYWYETNRITSSYLERILTSNSDRQITLDK